MFCYVSSILSFMLLRKRERRKAMSKYNTLWEYVQKSRKESFHLTFEEIQEIAGIPIDHSLKVKTAKVKN